MKGPAGRDLGPWDHGTMGPWDHGTMGPWPEVTYALAVLYSVSFAVGLKGPAVKRFPRPGTLG